MFYGEQLLFSILHTCMFILFVKNALCIVEFLKQRNVNLFILALKSIDHIN
jgi:hypothetical protein